MCNVQDLTYKSIILLKLLKGEAIISLLLLFFNFFDLTLQHETLGTLVNQYRHRS